LKGIDDCRLSIVGCHCRLKVEINNQQSKINNSASLLFTPGGPMQRVALFVAVMSVSMPAFAQHVHVEEAQAAPPQTTPPPAAPGPGQRGRQAGPPPIEVPWDDSIPAGTMEHAARAVKESPRHGVWVDL
jgi:hypothetical protein